MKKIIFTTICCLCASIVLNAQGKSTTYNSMKAEDETQFISMAQSQPANLEIVSAVLTPNSKFDITRSSNTPIKNAGKSLKRAGQYLLWGTTATVLGQILILAGEPISGILLSLGGTVVIYFGYGQINQAGKQLQQSGND